MDEIQITLFDVSDYLSDEEVITEYLNAVLEENDSELFLAALGDIAKAKAKVKIKN